jgi:predicted metal-binding membrane protein
VTGQSRIGRLLERDRLIVTVALLLCVAGAAGFILAGGGSGMSSLDMAAETGPLGALISGTPDMVMVANWTPGYAMMIFVMWWLMMVAMMVPSAAPTILLYGALNRERGSAGMLEFLAGYLAVWAGFSVLATAVQGLLAAGGLISMMYWNLVSPYLGAAVLVAAGVYQLTPVKQACLEQCRGPVATLTRHRRVGRFAAFRMGIRHGWFCLGCCWGLMALLFVGGVMNLWWIACIAIYIGIEKLAPFGDRLTRPLAFLLIAGGVGLLLNATGVI